MDLLKITSRISKRRLQYAAKSYFAVTQPRPTVILGATLDIFFFGKDISGSLYTIEILDVINRVIGKM